MEAQREELDAARQEADSVRREKMRALVAADNAQYETELNKMGLTCLFHIHPSPPES